jgi:hypothetical protein
MRSAELDQRTVAVLVAVPGAGAVQEVSLRNRAIEVLGQDVLDVSLEHLHRQDHIPTVLRVEPAIRSSEQLRLEAASNHVVVLLTDQDHVGV